MQAVASAAEIAGPEVFEAPYSPARRCAVVFVAHADAAAAVIEPVRAMQVSVAPLPRLITVPTAMITGEPAVFVAAAVFHPVTQLDVAAAVVVLLVWTSYPA